MKHLFFIVFIVVPFFSFSQWLQEGDDIGGEHAGDLSGYSVSLNSDGSIIAIGAIRNGDASIDAGHVRVYKNTSGVWSQLGTDINGEAAGDQSGWSTKLSADGNTVAIGSKTNDGVNGIDSGHIRVYTYNNGTNTWTQLGQDVDGKVANDRFGGAIDLSSDGRTIVVGAKLNGNNGMYSGHVQVYNYNIVTNSWLQLGSDINGEREGDQCGYSVGISNDGRIIAIGSTRNDDGGNNSGHVRVFNYNEGTNSWDQLGSDIDGEFVNNQFGASVSLNGDGSIVAAGSYFNSNGGSASGHVIIYSYNSGTNCWIQLGNEIQGENIGDNSGYAISLNNGGSVIAIGAIKSDGINANDSGHVRIFKYNSGMSLWQQMGSDIDGEGTNDQFGRSVSLSEDGSTVVVGAYNNAGNGLSSGHTRVYKNTTTLGLVSKHLDYSLKAFPNPGRGIIDLVFNTIHTNIELCVFNVFGKRVTESTHQNTDHISLNTYNYPIGIYIIKAKTTNRAAVLKLVIR